MTTLRRLQTASPSPMRDAITVSVMSAKPASYIPQSPRLLDQLREVLRYKHYSLRTEESYVNWVKLFARLHGCNAQVRHPRAAGRNRRHGHRDRGLGSRRFLGL